MSDTSTEQSEKGSGRSTSTDDAIDPAGEASADRPKRVVYLLGAGATQGCISHAGSDEQLLMRGDFQQRLFNGMNDLYLAEFSSNVALGRLVNDVVNENTDFEQLITFLGDARSSEHRQFALGLRKVFFDVLTQALSSVETELADRRSLLLDTLIDMHQVTDSGETLRGFITLNYDAFLEHAIAERHGMAVDFGIHVDRPRSENGSIRVLKLHGSFDWSDTWPVEVGVKSTESTWIPPGIKKVKTEYPFNALWGMAHELLDCDVLRIIGCNLGPNDWDLVSLLFATRHAHAQGNSYTVEIISWPRDAAAIAERCPYLSVRSLLELPGVGPMMIAEALGDMEEFDDLEPDDQRRAISHANKRDNPFAYWLKVRGEVMNRDLVSVDTPLGLFEDFLAS